MSKFGHVSFCISDGDTDQTLQVDKAVQGADDTLHLGADL